MRIAFLAVFLLQSCATTIISHKKNPPFQVPQDLKKKSLTVRAYHVTNWHSNQWVQIRKDDDYESSLKELLPAETVARHPEADYVSFSGEDAVKKKDAFLAKDLSKIETDYYLDVFTEHEWASHHDPRMFLYIVWGAAHVVSLGLFPIYWPHMVTQEARLYDKSGKLIKTSKAASYAGFWTWSPFIFRKDATKGVDHKAAAKNNTHKLLNKVFTK